MHGFYQVWKRNQEDVGNSSFTAMCSYDNWRMAWYAFIKLLHVNTSAEFMCDICGPVPEIVVCDATSLGFQRKFASLVFTQKQNIDDVVIQRKS